MKAHGLSGRNIIMQWSGRRVAFAILLALPLAACAHAQAEVAAKACRITLTAAPDLNRDASGRPSPVPIRVYAIRNAEKLSRADYFQIVDRERDVLADDLIARKEVVLRPGQSQSIVLDVPREGSPVIVVVAGFRNIEHANWRLISPVPANGDLSVTLTGASVKSASDVYQ
jgi:type VI secretion system protein VasD